MAFTRQGKFKCWQHALTGLATTVCNRVVGAPIGGGRGKGAVNAVRTAFVIVRQQEPAENASIAAFHKLGPFAHVKERDIPARHAC